MKKKEQAEKTYSAKDNNGSNIFVFGSNLAGIHGKGAARAAYRHWGAMWRHGVGRTGMAYAIPTKDENIKTLPLGEIQKHVNDFLEYAGKNQNLTFLVTRIGCGLAGYTDREIAPLFKTYMPHIKLPIAWVNLNKNEKEKTK